MKLRMTFFGHIRASLFIIIMFLGLIFLTYYIHSNTGKSFLIFAALFLILIFPTLYLHLNYYNAGKNYEYDLNENSITVIKDNAKMVFYKQNFKTIEFHMSGTRMAGVGVRNFPFENYYYAKIVMNNDDEIIISCLFSKKIDQILTSLYNDVPIINVKEFYPLV